MRMHHPPFAELGHGLDPVFPGAALRYRPRYRERPAGMPLDGAYGRARVAPLRIASWRWSGHPKLFELLDVDDDQAVDEYELALGLGRGLSLLRGETAGPLDEESWEGSAEVFRLVDADADRRVTRRDLEDALGPHAVRMAHGEPAHGPPLPEGARYGWTARARYVVFKNREDKARYMREAAEHDALDPQVLSWARQFRRLPEEARAAAILRFVQNDVRYERDPAWFDESGVRHGIEVLDSAPTGLFRGYGDCDLKARMFVALCLASGVQARIAPVFRGENGFPHVRAEVLRLGGEASDPHDWDVADATIVNSSIGRLPKKPLTAWPPGQAPSVRGG